MPGRRSVQIPHLRRLVSSLALAVGLAVSLGAASGCASALEKARVARDARDYPRAEQYYRTALTGDPADRPKAAKELAGLKVTQAHTKLKKGDAVAAEKLFREAMELDPKDDKAIDGLGRAQQVQGRLDEAIVTLSAEGCAQCKRYLSVLLLERAAKREAAKDIPGARDDYQKAQALVPDVTTALAIARLYDSEGDAEATLKAVEAAVPLIREDDGNSQITFRAMREKGVLAAAPRGDVATIDRWLNLFPPGAGGEDWYTLQLRLTQQLYRDNHVDLATARARHLLSAKYASTLPAHRKSEFERFLADVYRLIGVKFLRDGKIVEADDNFRQAMEFAPEDNKIKLLRALAIAGMKDVPKAQQVLAALPKETKGYNEVAAILESMVVHNKLAEDDLEGAKAALARAQAASSEQPEVHVAMAEMLIVSPIAGLPKKALKDLKKNGLVKYPNDEVNRYGEALSELAWAREQATVLGDSYLFRGPGIVARMAALDKQIRAFYPFPVEFNPDSTTILKLRGTGGEVLVKGPGDFEATASVPAGGTTEVTVREPGLVTLRVGKRTVVLVTEPYTKLTVEL
jgi:thioredoxin-like negative regulator of GroEL